MGATAVRSRTIQASTRWPHSGSTRPATANVNIEQRIVEVRADKKKDRLRDLLKADEVRNAIIFCNRKTTVRELATSLKRAGFKAIYLSGWQVAADGNLAGQTYPDQSLYPANSVPAVVRRVNNALLRQDQIERAEGEITRDWLAPIVADAEDLRTRVFGGRRWSTSR